MIINATNIGQRLSGIGRYTLSLTSYFLRHWEYPFKLFVNRNGLEHFARIENQDKIRVVSARVSPDFHFKGHLRRLAWTNWLCWNNPAKIVWNTSPLEFSLFHKKQIVTVHDIIPLIFPEHHKKQAQYFRYVIPKILKDCVRIIAVSEYTKRLILERFPISGAESKIKVIHCGIGDAFFDSSPDEARQNYILYVGRLSRTKNIERLVQAFGILIERHKLDSELYLTGYESELDFRLDNLGKTTRDKLHFLGSISDEKLKHLYRNASLLAFPSFAEGFGLPPLEAMACGCPVVVSRVSSLPEVCGDAARYVDPYDVESIADGIYNVITDKALRAAMIQKGMERAPMFRWEQSAKEHIHLLESLLE